MMNKYIQSDPNRSPLAIAPALLRLNVSGREYDIPESIARSHVGSMFALLATCGYTNSDFGESDRRRFLSMRRIVNIHQRWFVERTPSMFEIVLQYVYTRHLHCPSSVCDRALRDEMKFWRLHNVPISECCWEDETDLDGLDGGDPLHFDEDEETNEELDEETSMSHHGEGGNDGAAKKESEKSNSPQPPSRFSIGRRMSLGDALKLTLDERRRKWYKFRKFLWKICHGPSAWIPAKIFNCFCVFFILLSIINLMLSTLPELQCDFDQQNNSTSTGGTANTTSSVGGSTTSTAAPPPTTTRGIGGIGDDGDDKKFTPGCPIQMAFDIIEATCIAWFSFEIAARFVSFPDRRLFFRSAMNIIDILATAPYFVELILRLVGAHVSEVSTLMVVLRILRMLRIFRVLRLARYFESLKLFGNTVAKSRQELGVLVMFLLLSMIIFSSLMYYTEKDQPDTAFQSIPASLYWAIITLTTVGYGDITPKTPFGKFCAGMACVVGILVLAFPVSILVERFNENYKAKRIMRRRRFFDQDPKHAKMPAEFQYSENHGVASRAGEDSTHSQYSRSDSSQSLSNHENNISTLSPSISNYHHHHFVLDQLKGGKPSSRPASIASKGSARSARDVQRRNMKINWTME